MKTQMELIISKSEYPQYRNNELSQRILNLFNISLVIQSNYPYSDDYKIKFVGYEEDLNGYLYSYGYIRY